jgi:hypothetical protein
MRVAQRSFPAPNVSLTAISDSSSGKTDCSIGIVTGSTGDGLAGTPVAKKEPCKRGYCPMANLRVRVRCEDLDEVRHNVGNAKALCAAPLTRKAMRAVSRTDATGSRRARRNTSHEASLA